MAPRDLRGEEIPVGKIERSLEYDGIAASGSPEWLTVFGDATERTGSVAEGRGELHLAVDDGSGGLRGPGLDPEAFRELRLRVGITPELTEHSRLLLGFTDAPESIGTGGWCVFREYGGSNRLPSGELRTGRLWYGADGEATETGNLGKITGGSALVEIRIRPFEAGVTVAVGGAGRGDVLYDEAGCAFAFSGPVFPIVAIGNDDQSELARLSVSTLGVTIRHN